MRIKAINGDTVSFIKKANQFTERKIAEKRADREEMV